MIFKLKDLKKLMDRTSHNLPECIKKFSNKFPWDINSLNLGTNTLTSS